MYNVQSKGYTNDGKNTLNRYSVESPIKLMKWKALRKHSLQEV